MTWEIFITIVGFIGTAIAIITPIIKLNVSITKLTCSVDELNKRLVASDNRIDGCEAELKNHEKRITNIEIKGGFRE